MRSNNHHLHFFSEFFLSLLLLVFVLLLQSLLFYVLFSSFESCILSYTSTFLALLFWFISDFSIFPQTLSSFMSLFIILSPLPLIPTTYLDFLYLCLYSKLRPRCVYLFINPFFALQYCLYSFYLSFTLFHLFVCLFVWESESGLLKVTSKELRVSLSMNNLNIKRPLTYKFCRLQIYGRSFACNNAATKKTGKLKVVIYN